MLGCCPHGRTARRNPAPAHDVERVAGRRVAPARLDVQKLVVLPDEDLLDGLQRPLTLLRHVI